MSPSAHIAKNITYEQTVQKTFSTSYGSEVLRKSLTVQSSKLAKR